LLLLEQQRRALQGKTGGGGSGGTIALFLVGILALMMLLNGTGAIHVGGAAQASSPSQRSNSGGSGGAADGQKLLAEAVKFDDKAYVWGGGHPPTEAVVSRGVDCSGLISVSVLRAFGINDDRLAEGFRRSPHWKRIDMKDARAGDIMYRLIATHGGDTDHVVFVVENKGSKNLKIFEARTSNGPRDQQIRFSDKKYSEFTGALRFTR
jgi:cell wall-associated NlpC family hydrolase